VSLNSWFKHYNNAHEGQSIFNLWASNQPEVIAFYWTLLELVSRWELEESRGELQLNLSTLRAKLGMNSQRSKKLLLKIEETFKIEVLWINEESFRVSIPNWLELQERRGGKRESKFHQSSTETGIEERGKKKEERIQSNDVFDFESVYQHYPRKSGKSEGMVRLSEIITSQADFDLFSKAVLNYAKDCELNKTPEGFVKQFSSFVGTKKIQRWRDYIDLTPSDRRTEKEKSLSKTKPTQIIVEDLPSEYNHE